jgi:hypothetical protein
MCVIIYEINTNNCSLYFVFLNTISKCLAVVLDAVNDFIECQTH